MAKRIGRREFLKGAAVGGGGLVILSTRSLRAYAANAKPNVAVIGCGGRGSCFTHDYEYAGGRRYSIVAMCDVNEKKATKAYQTHPKVPKFHDYRKMLDEKEREIDCVIVATSDQSHAPASVCAMEHGKHTYCEKGLTHTIYESRVMRKVAEEKRLATQMGNQGSTSGQHRRGVELVQDGALGEIKEVYIWNCGGGSDYKSYPKSAEKVPGYLKWDLWLGPTEQRDFNSKWMRWSQWRCFGTGKIGMWMSHSGFLAWNAMKIGALWDMSPRERPRVKVRAKVSNINKISFPKWELVELEVPAREGLAPITYTWVNGDRQGEGRKRIERHLRPHMGRQLYWGDNGNYKEHGGALIVGTDGLLRANEHNGGIWLYPEDKFADVDKKSPKRLPRSRGSHVGDWLASCGDGRYTLSDFRNSGRYFEFLQLINIANQLDEEIEYDPLECKITNSPKADELIHFDYRDGWSEKLSRRGRV